VPADTIESLPTVLVVDDDGDLLEILGEVIEEEGYRAVTARNGEQALALLREGERPCLILLDLKMPGMSGEEFRRFQLADERFAQIPVVGFTGHSDVEVRRIALTSVLRKPVKLHHLLETIAHYCSDPDHLEGFEPAKSATG
jgi:two-component system chemotaxis response regulator CheY